MKFKILYFIMKKIFDRYIVKAKKNVLMLDKI